MILSEGIFNKIKLIMERHSQQDLARTYVQVFEVLLLCYNDLQVLLLR